MFEDGKGWSGLSNTSNGFELCDYVEDGPMINVCKFNDSVSLLECICPQLNCLFDIIFKCITNEFRNIFTNWSAIKGLQFVFLNTLPNMTEQTLKSNHSLQKNHL